MQLRKLGASGLKVTPIALGTWAIGGWMWGGTDEKKAIDAIHASIENGINAIDTAPIYGMGFSEEVVGKALKGKRDQVILATKCGLRWAQEDKSVFLPNQDFKTFPITITKNLKPQSIVFECEQSLKRLGVDVIDLYQIHWPDDTTPMEDSWNAMVKLKHQGKVRALGCCNYNLEQLKTIHQIHPVDSVQLPYSLIRRNIEQDIIPFCQENNIAVIVYSPLERGLFTGKYHGNDAFPKGDHRKGKKTFSPEYLALIQLSFDKILPIAQKHQLSLAQVIIHCTIHRLGITTALVGARDSLQACENAASASFQLSDQERELIADALSPIELQRPLYD